MGNAPKIRICSPAGHKGIVTGTGTQIFLEDGTELTNVRSVEIGKIEPGKIVGAAIELELGGIDIEAHYLLGIETITEAALAHGYKLVPIEEDKPKMPDGWGLPLSTGSDGPGKPQDSDEIIFGNFKMNKDTSTNR